MRLSWSHCVLLAAFSQWTEEVSIHGNSITLVKLARTLSDIIEVILESKRLGAMVTTLIPWRARSLVIGKVREAIAPLEALYATTNSVRICFKTRVMKRTLAWLAVKCS